MEFLLRIFFSGMITFIPSADGTELTVLLLDTHQHTISDGSALAHHKPILVARALECTNTCTPRNPVVANFLFAEQPAEQAADALETAVLGGGAWDLSNAELSIRKVTAGEATMHPALTLTSGARGSENGHPKAIPTTPQERKDFSWVPDLEQIVPSFGNLDPELFAARPPSDVVAARLKLRNGTFSTYSLVRVDNKVKPVNFRTLGSTTNIDYSQAVAGWVVAEIWVPGEQIEIVAKDFDTGAQRSMKLKHKDNLIEMAILNLPPFVVPDPTAERPAPQPGKHFEAYYDLAATRPAAASRPVPYVPACAPEASWDSVHPPAALWSALLEKIRLNADRGPLDVTICPTSQNGLP